MGASERFPRVPIWALSAFAVLGCQSADERPPAYSRGDPASEPSGTGGSERGIRIPSPRGGATSAAPDGSVVCGGDRIPAIVERPNLYFLIDASGSMAQPVSATGVSKFTATRRAIGALLRAIGHRVRYGASVFPASSGARDCGGGRELLTLTDGDALGTRSPSQNGPVLQYLIDRLTVRAPGGPTPLVSALTERRPHLELEANPTYLVLATDGAPNCNTEAFECESDRCIPDIEGAWVQSTPPLLCGVDLSCCDESRLGVGASTQCMDDARALAEIGALHAAGVATYVIGMPGSEAYAALLGGMARAGGTARVGATPYYAVGDEEALTQALFEIGTGVAIDCDLTLETSPEDPALVNVYFDRTLVPYDGGNGWEWTSEQELVLRGEACSVLRSGAVFEVEVVYGCRTVVK